MRPTPIELLAPARNAEVGRVAVSHGADAVYIGAPQFSARQAAGCSVAEIEGLCTYAHRYGAKVCVALNTILTDDELREAERLITSLYEAGADALIVQDMGILSLHLPPISLHASTQCDIRTATRAACLRQAGFSRVVLARELSLQQIRSIHEAVDVEIEAFVHGALCVSYSGQCYLSQALRGRSANRGCCAQMCRLPYDLTDATGRVISRNRHLLSLKDMDRSAQLAEMIEAGVVSLKIEGRLKDADYVKNVVAYYRQKLDQLFLRDPRYEAASWGRTEFFFTPNPEKTFHRSATDYFLHERTRPLTNPLSPKSTGEPVGQVTAVGRGRIEVDTRLTLHNGDGFSIGGDGFQATRVEGNTIYAQELPAVKVGDRLYRNLDRDFQRQLSGKTAERRLPLNMIFEDTAEGFRLTVSEPCSGRSATADTACTHEPARNAEQAAATIEQQLARLGNTDYYLQNLDLRLSQAYFLPASTLNDLRRRAVESLRSEGESGKSGISGNSGKSEKSGKSGKSGEPGKSGDCSYLSNVSNEAAAEFYRRRGAEVVEPAFELKPVKDARLMTCMFCLKYENGWCPRQRPQSPPAEPLYLLNGSDRLRLEFDCQKCEMIVRMP